MSDIIGRPVKTETIELSRNVLEIILRLREGNYESGRFVLENKSDVLWFLYGASCLAEIFSNHELSAEINTLRIFVLDHGDVLIEFNEEEIKNFK